MPPELAVEVVVGNDRYDEQDPRWLDQVALLSGDLRRATDAFQARRTPVAGTKGAVDQLILTLGSAGVFTVAVQVITTWLSRDRRRTVELVFNDAEGNEQKIRITAENAGRDSLEPLITAVSALAQEKR